VARQARIDLRGRLQYTGAMARKAAAPTPPHRTRPARSIVERIVVALRVSVASVAGLLALLTLSEVPAVARWLGPLGSQVPLVGIVAGHWQHDSGAVCPDGLEEVELTVAIAGKVAQILRRQGYRVEVLPEYSPKLDGYRAAALIAIHADSCVDGLSGYKVARYTGSAAPDVNDRLVRQLNGAYSIATGLRPHTDTITEDMRQYHALRRIDPETPGAIIECGFMGGDRYLLTREQDRVAVGIANGLLAFLRETAPLPTATPALVHQ
jgi:N-acetylmuramoyl-L-alanine amidase